MQIDEIHALQSVGALDSTKKLVQEHELVLKQPQRLKYSLFHHFEFCVGTQKFEKSFSRNGLASLEWF